MSLQNEFKVSAGTWRAVKVVCLPLILLMVSKMIQGYIYKEALQSATHTLKMTENINFHLGYLPMLPWKHGSRTHEFPCKASLCVI